MTSLRIAVCSAGLGLLAVLLAQPAWAVGNEERELQLEYVRREMLLRTAKPAPTRPGRVFSPKVSASPKQRQMIGYDLTTGEVKVLPADSRSPVFELPPDPGFFGEAGPLTWEKEDGNDQAKITPTLPEPVYYTHSYPWSTIFKLLMRFEVDGEDYWYSCSAATAGTFHLISAGHCIYNFDPNDDDDESDAKWADEVYAYAGQTDIIAPIGTADRPYGESKAVYQRTYNGWIDDHNYDHDWAVITLDRPIGDHVGWMGRDTNPTTSLNFTGYPTEEPYVPENTLVQYHGFDAYNVIEYTDYQILLDAYIFGGHGGGPAWIYDSVEEDRWIAGINSTSNREGSASNCLLTSAKRDDLNNWMRTDEGSRAPVLRPELVEYVRNPSEVKKDLHDNQVQPGGAVELDYNYYNAGHVESGDVTIDFFLSSNTIISPQDILVDSVYSASLDVRNYRNWTTTVDIPSSVPNGIYFLGWRMSSSIREYNENDYGVIADETLTVGSSCSPPPTPSGLRSSSGSVASGTSYTISWNIAANADSYEVQESTNSSFWGASTHSRTSSSCSFSHTVGTTTTYYYRVSAKRNCGARTGWSSSVSVSVTYTEPPPGDFQYLLAGIAAAPGSGGSNWRSYLAVCNRSGATANLTLIYRHGSGTITRTHSLGIDDIVGWDNVVSSLFGVSGSSSGSVEVVSTREVTALARTYNNTADGTYGQFLPGVDEEGMLSYSQQGLLGMLRKTGDYRTNIGFVNPGTSSCNVRIKLYSSTGSQLGLTLTDSVSAGGWKQVNYVFDAAGVSQASVAYAIVEVTTSGGKVWAYASLVDGESGDPTTIPMVNLG